MIRRPPRSTPLYSSAASDLYKRQLSDLLPEAERLVSLSGIRVRGVMTMASFSATESQLHRTFAEAREGREELIAAGHPAEEVSMGMSNDYEIAVEEGATLV